MKEKASCNLICLVMALLALVVFGFPARAKANLIVNGDFEAGNTGFTTNYTYTDSQPNGLHSEGYYAIGVNPSYYHPSAVSYGDHTSGYGNMMIVNGHTELDVTLWQQTVSISPNTEYEFSLWLSNWYESPLAQLEYFINDISIGSSFAPENPGEWVRYSELWQSGSNTMATIRIVDRVTEYGGNDFAIDDISFLPEPATICLLGLGMLALLRKRRV